MSNYSKLKTNLKLAIQRLKLLEKKKTELSLKSRKEIADYLGINKVDRAKIRVEHIIREDNYVEAMEMLEMFCDLLIARFGLIEKMKELDPGLDESIATIIWASPRVSSDIQEIKIISDILTQKYGKKYAEACRADSINNVNEKVKRRLGFEAPPKLLVEQYLIEIAKNFQVPYVPDNDVMLASGQMSEELIQLRDTVDEITKKNGGNGGNNNYGRSGGSGGQGAEAAYYSTPMPTIPAAYPPNFSHINEKSPSAYPPTDQKSTPIGFNETPTQEFNAPPLPSKAQDFYSNQENTSYEQDFYQSPPPSYNTKSNNQTLFPQANAPKNDEDDFLNLPSIPTDNNNSATNQNASIEFDDLAKRFENLKSFK